MSQISAVIYDMDGLLLNSEPCWHEAEKVIFRPLGIELTTEMCLQTTGVPVPEVISYWYEKHPWPNPDFKTVEDALQAEALKQIKENANLMPGALASLQHFKSKGLKIGLASASLLSFIEAVLEKHHIGSYFDFYHSAALEEKSKPDPAVYLTVARTLGVPIETCFIMEDSKLGVQGAKKSGAVVCAIPSEHDFNHPAFDIADYKVNTLNEAIGLV